MGYSPIGNDAIIRGNRLVNTIKKLEYEDQLRIIDFIDNVIQSYEVQTCMNCKHFISYENLSDQLMINNPRKQQGFGFCDLLGMYADDEFGCKEFTKGKYSEDSDSNINNDEIEEPIILEED